MRQPSPAQGTSVTLDRGNGTYTYQVRACAIISQFLRCSDYSTVTASSTETVSGSTLVPPMPASITAPTPYVCTGNPNRTYTISWSAVAEADSYDLSELNDTDQAQNNTVSYAAGTTSHQFTHHVLGNSSDTTIFSYDVAACKTTGGTRRCSTFGGRPAVCVGHISSINSTPLRTSYDAFGKVREGDFTDCQDGLLQELPTTLRGFTGLNHNKLILDIAGGHEGK